MLKKLLLFFSLLISTSSFCQEINGIIYDSESRIEGIKVLNITKKILAVTNKEGEFVLKANVSDTLSFQSVFYRPVQVVVKPNYFEDVFVFELQKIINELDEVNIKDKPKEKLFGEKAFNANLKEVLEKDKKKEIQQYTPAPKYGLDFIRVAKFIGKLFKKKKTQKPNTLSYNQYKLLFEENNFFTKKMLTQDLKIPEQYHSLFFEFLEEKAIPENKLNYNLRLQLLNDFTIYSEEFLILVEIAEEQAKD